MGRENSSVSGVVVGYTQLKDAVDTIIIDCQVPSFANRDRRERWKPHLVIIIVMVLEGMMFKPLSLSFSALMRLETMIPRLARYEKRPKSRIMKVITDWMNFMIHQFASMTNVTSETINYRYGDDEKLIWIENKCVDKDFCENNIGVRKIFQYDDTIGNKGKVLHYDDMLADQQAKAKDKANRRKPNELRSVGPRMAELLSHLGSQNEMGSGSVTGGGSGEGGDNDEGGNDDECFHLWRIYP
ncbi:CSC1-like protein [Tanacetum coccineum]